MTDSIPVYGKGSRFHFHPASDYWMRGVKTATVITVGRKWVTLRVDMAPAQTFRIPVRSVNAHVDYVTEE